MLQKLLMISLAGAAGTLSRYVLLEGVTRSGVRHSWIATSIVNVLGCFLFGYLYAVLQGRVSAGPILRTALLTGYIGAFTTFSTFVFDIARMMKTTQWTAAFAAAAGQIFFGLLAMVLGVLTGLRA
ncbi:MAG: fluoride efflux transporter FluC [Armatimonadota bacterium]